MPKTNKYDLLLSIFTSTDNLRPALTRPGTLDQHTYATDGYSVIKIHKELCGLRYSNKDFPNAEKVFARDNADTYQLALLSTEELLTSLLDCKLKAEHQQERCDSCDGHGEKECKCCGNEADCEDCEGTGTVDVTTNYARISCYGQDVELLGHTFTPKLLYRVAECALLLKQQQIQVAYTPGPKAVQFTVGPCQIILMPKHKYDA